LGDRVHLSSNAVADRVRRLTRQGVVRRFTVDVDQAALGRDLEAVIDVLINNDAQDFASRALERDEITWMSYITGRVDFRMHVSCAGARGLDELLAFLKEIGARETNTTVVLRRLR
jgi:Lrp/AsnC family leucine-responsive transcriptional regulator